MMKKSLFFLAVISFSMKTFAQTDPSGKVGIDTTTPTETLHVSGTSRVSDLPLSGAGTIYNGTTIKNVVSMG